MKMYTSTDFWGHWPIGVAAVIIAENREVATKMLEDTLISRGLKPKCSVHDEKVSVHANTKPRVIILNDGEY